MPFGRWPRNLCSANIFHRNDSKTTPPRLLKVDSNHSYTMFPLLGHIGGMFPSSNPCCLSWSLIHIARFSLSFFCFHAIFPLIHFPPLLLNVNHTGCLCSGNGAISRTYNGVTPNILANSIQSFLTRGSSWNLNSRIRSISSIVKCDSFLLRCLNL